jgi:hypothetical protein
VKLASTETVKPDMLYKGHRCAISEVGKGWRVMIYAPGSVMALPESPPTLEECPREAIIAEAKWIVDARCTATS